MRQAPDGEAALLGGFLAGTISAVLLASESGLAPLQRPLTFGLVFWGWCLVFATPAALALVLVSWLIARASGAPRLPQLCFGASMLVFLGAVFAVGSHAVAALASLEGPGPYRWLAPSAFVLSVLAALALALRPEQRRRPARLLAALSGAAFPGAFLPPSATNATRAAVPVASRAIARQRFLLVGVDGDVLPLLLYLKGFPVATDLAGRMPVELFDPAFVSANPLLRVASYGRRDRLALGGAPATVDEEARRRLRALGYIN